MARDMCGALTTGVHDKQSLFVPDNGMGFVSKEDVVRKIKAIAHHAGCENTDTDFSTRSMRIGGDNVSRQEQGGRTHYIEAWTMEQRDLEQGVHQNDERRHRGRLLST